jgi:hypothetical protein
MQSIRLAILDVDGLRTRLRKKSDKALREFGEAAKYVVSPRANLGKPPLPAFVLQLEEARAEWCRRKETAVDKLQRLIQKDSEEVPAADRQ